ncbi:hypothetical protein BV914_05115 [Neisseria dumasiana]|nr:hypothetical protein BV914_05115 [Neisseria dumasiana]
MPNRGRLNRLETFAPECGCRSKCGNTQRTNAPQMGVCKGFSFSDGTFTSLLQYVFLFSKAAAMRFECIYDADFF